MYRRGVGRIIIIIEGKDEKEEKARNLEENYMPTWKEEKYIIISICCSKSLYHIFINLNFFFTQFSFSWSFSFLLFSHLSFFLVKSLE